MPIELRRVHWAPWVLCIVMLVASGLTGSGVNLHAVIGCLSGCLVPPRSLRHAAKLQPLTGTYAPTCGPVRRSVRLQGSRSFHLAVPRAAPCLSDRPAWSCDPHCLPASFRCLALPCFLTFQPFRAALLPLLPAHLEPADDLAPLAASAVREGFSRRIFPACFPTLLRASQPPRLG